MSSRIAKAPAQQDQRKIYLDWANHYLHRAGFTDVLLDLKDISDGNFLPKVIQAVVQGVVPAIHNTAVTDDQKRENIENCIQYLQAIGMNCSSCQPKDICDGNMRAILSLFYNLSQHKKMSSKETAGSHGDHQPSRISRPISPGPKSTISVGTPGSSGIPSTSMGKSPAATRRTAGSSIMTSTNYNRPYGQRRIPYKPITIDGNNKPVLENGNAGEDNKAKDRESSGSEESLTKMPASDSKLVSPSSKLPQNASLSRAPTDTHDPPGRSKSAPYLASKLAAPSQRIKEKENRGEARSKSPANELEERPPSRLRQPTSGRSTPLSQTGRSTPSLIPGMSGRSGIARPSSRNAKTSQVVDRSAEQNGEVAEHEEGEEKLIRKDSRLRLQRKGSDGPTRRHRVNTIGTVGIESGTDSLPRNLPKGVLSSGLVPPGSHRKTGATPEPKAKDFESAGDFSDRVQVKGDGILVKERKGGSEEPGKGAEEEKRGLKMPTKFSAGVRTPNLPSGPQASLVGEERSEPPPSSSGVPTSKLRKMPERKIPTPHASMQRSAIPSSGGGAPSMKHRDTRTSSSNSSLESCTSGEIKLTNSANIDRNGQSLEKSANKSEVVQRKADVPFSLQLSSEGSRQDQHGGVVEGKILSPPPAFKSLEKASETSPKGDVSRYSRRISPEGMSHGDDSSPVEENQSGDKMAENNLKNEQEIEREKKPMVISERLNSDSEPVTQKKTELSDSSVKAASEVSSPTANEAENGSDEGSRGVPPSQLPAGSHASQPETGQPYSEGMAQLSPPVVQKRLPQLQPHPQTQIRHHSEDSEEEQGTKSDVHHNRSSRVEEITKSPTKRARSLSPKSSHRINLHSPINSLERKQLGTKLDRTASNDITRHENRVSSPSRKSCLRNSNKSPSSSSSSLEGGRSASKVTISPRSSQLVYNPEETGLHPPPSYSMTSYLSPKHLSHNRPQSFAESINSSSDSSSPPGSVHGIPNTFPWSKVDTVRRVSTLSEKLDYREVANFLRPNLQQVAEHSNFGSTPEVLQSFENQLSTMRQDLANKDRMLSMYESSMADLSSKVHLLKKSLEEKDQEIRHLTEEKHGWFDIEGRSLASRAASEAGMLSDGCLSDSAMDQPNGKGRKKKKKLWKRSWSFRRQKKEVDLSPHIDVESVISARSSRSIRRHPSRGKADLMSIAELSPDHKFKDPDTKSTYTIDNHSDSATIGWGEELIRVFEDSSPGAKVQVVLQTGYVGYHGNSMGDPGDGEHMAALGTLSLAPEVSWVTMDTKISDIFMHHINSIDQDGYLGLKEDSILHYFIGDQCRKIGNALLPPLTPYQALSVGSPIRIVMRGAAEDSCDSLAYKMLMNSETIQSYVAMLKETQWVVVMGTKGTCKTSLVTGLAKHLALCVSGDDEAQVISFNVDKFGVESALKYLRTDLAKRIQRQLYPPILLLDEVYECHALEQILDAASALSKRPYIIATLCSGNTKGIPLHQLLFHHQIRVITCNPQSEPIIGILSRSLRKQVFNLKANSHPIDTIAERMLQWLPYLLEHLNTFINKFHSNSVALGPRVLMSCPVELSPAEIETWFINLWNHFVIPYLMGTIMAGIETYTADPQLEWTDVREWVVDTYPWQPSMNVNKLRTLNPEDVGWNHAVRPQQSRFMIIKDDDDTRSILRLKNSELSP